MIKSNRHGDGSVKCYSDTTIFDNRILGNEWLTTKQAANFLSISENALRIMVYRNQIQVYRLGRRLRFLLKDCFSLIQKGKTNGN